MQILFKVIQAPNPELIDARSTVIHDNNFGKSLILHRSVLKGIVKVNALHVTNGAVYTTDQLVVSMTLQLFSSKWTFMQEYIFVPVLFQSASSCFLCISDQLDELNAEYPYSTSSPS